jgi:FKBP-type peptidyl-prolyl cis-trans isomerase
MRFILAILLFTTAAQAQSPAPDSPTTDDQKALYTLGQLLGQNVANVSLTEEELKVLIQGLSDQAFGRPAKVDTNENMPLLQTFMTQRLQAAADAELVKAKAFLEEQAKKPGAIKTDSGIVIEELKAGTGPTPISTDTVKVHYHGTLRDGTVFDSSVDRNEPALFPLSQAIACWTEGVQHIHVGGKSRLTCPADLAYGVQGRPGIPANAALTFEVELLEIVVEK